ncbi:MAG: putative transporter [Bacteroidales bacterium]|nr:putative transporter [Bacteroidales bacterium]
MNWLKELITTPDFTQAVLVMSLICGVGLALGKIRIFGVSLGATFVFFAGILAGHLGLVVNPDMLTVLQNFGLIIFIYALGVQVGPGFFSSFKKGGFKLNMLATLLMLVGTLMLLILHWTTNLGLPNLMGLFSGAVTNTPMLGSAQQALLQVYPENASQANDMAMACAVGYPFGLVGMVICVAIIQKMTAGKTNRRRANHNSDNTFITEYVVSNAGIIGKSIQEIRSNAKCQFVISRIWKDGKVIIPTGETVIEENEHILVISGKSDVQKLTELFGPQENVDWNKKGIDWNAIDNQLISRKILVTKPGINGTKLGDLRLRNSFGINITRVNRAGIDLLPSRSLRLQLGDRLTIVGEARSIENAAQILGNEAKQLRTPNLTSVFIGIVVGLILGSIPFAIPGMSMPVKLGIAGGPIIIGIIMGAFGPRLHFATYISQSASLMLRQLGLTIYLAGLGLSAGARFFETVFSAEGLKWVAISCALAIVPVLIVGFIASKMFKTDYAKNVGMLCGSMANPIALNYANSTTEGDEPAVAYATVYPISIFLRVISAQIIMLAFL